MSNTVYMMVGIPGSGKSTYAKEISEKFNAKVFSSDEYRKNLLGDEKDQSNNSLIFDALYKDMSHHLKEVGNAVFDATNISVKSRRKTFSVLDRLVGKWKYNSVAVCCIEKIDVCVERDKQRDRSVGKDVILRFVWQFEFPQYFEGFNYICDVKSVMNGSKYSDFVFSYDPCLRYHFISMMSGFDQKNKHHRYDVLTHSIALADSWKYLDMEMREASLFHDIGKCFTQTIDKDGNAHYYHHANYSAYVVASNLGIIRSSSVFNVLFYINQHMHIRDIIKSEKAINRYKELWGEERFNKLIEFMNNDNRASGREYE